MVSYEEATTEELISILKTYVPSENHVLVDFELSVKRAVVSVEWEDVSFELAFGKVILNTRDLSFKDAFPTGNKEV